MFWLRTHNGTMAAMANYQGGCLGSLHCNFARLNFWCHDFFAGFSELMVMSAMNLFKKTMCYINSLNSPLINSRLENLRTYSIHNHVENKLKPKYLQRFLMALRDLLELTSTIHYYLLFLPSPTCILEDKLALISRKWAVYKLT